MFLSCCLFSWLHFEGVYENNCIGVYSGGWIKTSSDDWHSTGWNCNCKKPLLLHMTVPKAPILQNSESLICCNTSMNFEMPSFWVASTRCVSARLLEPPTAFYQNMEKTHYTSPFSIEVSCFIARGPPPLPRFFSATDLYRKHWSATGQKRLGVTL